MMTIARGVHQVSLNSLRVMWGRPGIGKYAPCAGVHLRNFIPRGPYDTVNYTSAPRAISDKELWYSNCHLLVPDNVTQ